jgi:hypothetical protein
MLMLMLHLLHLLLGGCCCLGRGLCLHGLHTLLALSVSGVGAARGRQQRAVLAAVYLLLRLQLLLVHGVLA